MPESFAKASFLKLDLSLKNLNFIFTSSSSYRIIAYGFQKPKLFFLSGA